MRYFQVWLVWCLCVGESRADDWPQWHGPNRDSVWRESGLLKKFPEGGPKVLWRFNVGPGYSGPAVAQGKVLITDRQQSVANPGDPFERANVPGKERVICVEEKTGKPLWTHTYDRAYTVSYPAGPRTTPTIDGDRVYTLGTEGDLFCLSLTDGKVIWSRDLKKDYGVETPLWGFCSHPLVDEKRLYVLVGGEGTAVVGLDKMTGKELWRGLSSKEPGYAPAEFISVEGRKLLAIWLPNGVHALLPESGKEAWSVPFPVQLGLTLASPRQAGNRLFVSAFYEGSLMVELRDAKPEVLWKSKKRSERDTDGLHSLMSTPFLDGEYLYGICSYGQLRCLKTATGERVWESLSATGGKENRWGNAFLVRNGDRFFLANEQGDLIIAHLTPSGYEEISRAHVLEPTNKAAGRDVVWSHPAFANRNCYLRNDRELVAVSLAE